MSFKNLLKNLYFQLFLVLTSLVFLLLFLVNQNIFAKLGKMVFLDFHQNKLAVNILKLSNLNNNAEANFLLGRIYFVIGGKENLHKSVDFFSKSIDLIEGKAGSKNPKDFSTLSQSYYGRGLAYGFLGDIYILNAEKDFRKYIELEDEKEKQTGNRSFGSWAGYNDLAWILYLQGDFKNGEKIAKLGLERSYQNPWLLNMLGIFQIEQNNCKDGKKNLEMAYEILEKIDEIKWGEAYSGDASDRYKSGKENMLKSIKNNIEICSK